MRWAFPEALAAPDSRRPREQRCPHKGEALTLFEHQQRRCEVDESGVTEVLANRCCRLVGQRGNINDESVGEGQACPL